MVKRLTAEEFVSKAHNIHNFKYDYSDLVYVNNKTKVNIICPAHGSFIQTPNDHLLGHGCTKCKNLVVAKFHTKSTDKFVDEAKLLHGAIYDYSGVEYVDGRLKVEIICKTHGKFLQTPKIHLKGHGCPKCVGSVSKLEKRWLDILNIPSQNRNIFITAEDKKIRVDGLCNNVVYEFYGDYWHGNPNIYLSSKLNAHNKKTFGSLYDKTIKRENVLKQAGYILVSIWESDFKEQYAHHLRA